MGLGRTEQAAERRKRRVERLRERHDQVVLQQQVLELTRKRLEKDIAELVRQQPAPLKAS